MARKEWEATETDINRDYAEKLKQLDSMLTPDDLPPEGLDLIQKYRDLFKATRDYRRFLNREAYTLKTKGAKR